MRFDRIAILDWSAAKGPRRGRDSIWLGLNGGSVATEENLPTRTAAEMRLRALIADSLATGQRLLLGADFAFGFPHGLAAALTGEARALAVWGWLATRVRELPGDATSYREVAAEMNAHFPGEGPFWGNGQRADIPGLPRRMPPLPPGLALHRATDLAARGNGARPKPVWQLAGAGAVGAQVLTGLPVLHRLRRAFPGKVAVWPFEAAAAQVVLAEVYPSLLAHQVRAAGGIPDAAQVRLLACALARLSASGGLAALFDVPRDDEEGWILGSGHQAALARALHGQAPRSTR